MPAYKVMFGKLSLQNLFDDYFDQAGNMTSWIMLKPLEEPNIDLIATVSFQTRVLFLLLRLSFFPQLRGSFLSMFNVQWITN